MRDWKHVAVDAGIDIYFRPALALAAGGANGKTRMARSANTFRRAPTCRSTPPTTSTGSPSNSTIVPAKRLAFKKPIELIGDLLLR